ncbi:MAG: LysR family transcriptional regulator [Aristaeellaceae bacterium]
MDEKDFELLHVLEESRNITRAADKLYITQSALSKRIRAIERELGVELLLRSHQGIRFTPSGEAVLAHSRAAARELEQMRIQLDSMQGEICGTLNAGISINYALYRLPDALASYHSAYPKVRLQITTGQSRHLHRQMLEGSLDVAVIRGEYQWDGMRFLLGQENVTVICAREFADRPLSEYQYIGRKTDSSLEAQTLRWMNENGLGGQVAGFCVDSITTCVEMVKRGLGWSIVPEIALNGFDGCVRPCTFDNGEPFVRKTYLICQRESLALPQISAFVELLKKHR